jgi:hypothetical protein
MHHDSSVGNQTAREPPVQMNIAQRSARYVGYHEPNTHLQNETLRLPCDRKNSFHTKNICILFPQQASQPALQLITSAKSSTKVAKAA